MYKNTWISWLVVFIKKYLLISNPHVVACDISSECTKYDDHRHCKFDDKNVKTYLDFVHDKPTQRSHFSEIFHNKFGDCLKNSRHCLFAVFTHNLCSSRRPRNSRWNNLTLFNILCLIKEKKKNRTNT